MTVVDMLTIVFDAVDRCDRCGAQACVQAEKKPGKPELLFCGHHIRIHQDALLDSGYTLRWDDTKDYY